jgi:arylsulfatase A-like enzyme
LLPTLCAAAGISLPPDYACDGENLIATFKGQNTPRTRPIFWQWLGMRAEPDYWPRLAVRDGDWKLVMSDDAQRLELHQLKNDRA